MRNRKFVSYTVIRNSGCYRYLYREAITNGKDKVIKGKDVDPMMTVKQLADYFYDVIINNTKFPYNAEDTTVYDVILKKVGDLYKKSLDLGGKVGLVAYVESIEEIDGIERTRLYFSEKVLGIRDKYGLWGFTEAEADSTIYVTIFGGNAGTVYGPDQWIGGGGAEII